MSFDYFYLIKLWGLNSKINKIANHVSKNLQNYVFDRITITIYTDFIFKFLENVLEKLDLRKLYIPIYCMNLLQLFFKETRQINKLTISRKLKSIYTVKNDNEKLLALLMIIKNQVLLFVVSKNRQVNK